MVRFRDRKRRSAAASENTRIQGIPNVATVNRHPEYSTNPPPFSPATFRHRAQHLHLPAANHGKHQPSLYPVQKYPPSLYHVLGHGENRRTTFYPASKHQTTFYQNTCERRRGHRGQTRLPWGRGPREPPSSTGGIKPLPSTTLFIDGLPRSISPEWLKDLFAEYGRIHDVFISRKLRKNTKEAFGFVRFRNRTEALEAIKKLDGHAIKEMKIRVSMAKYDKGGASFSRADVKNPPIMTRNQPVRREIKSPAFRDSRKYSEVVLGKLNRHPPTQQGAEKMENIIPVFLTINLEEDPEKIKLMENAIVAENVLPLNLSLIVPKISDLNLPLSGMFSISPTKMLLSFSSKIESEKALDDESKLWSIFDDIREWSESENLDERLVWMDCFGLHPKCWNIDNVKKIGEQWGPVIHVVQKMDVIPSLTHARMLVRTKAQNKIDVRIRIYFDNGSRDVWVKECGGMDDPLVDFHIEGLGEEDHGRISTPCNSASSCVRVSDSIKELGNLEVSECGKLLDGPSVSKDALLEDLLIITRPFGSSSHVVWFDPMYEVEAKGGHPTPDFLVPPGSNTAEVCELNISTTGKRPRGRPKRVNQGTIDAQLDGLSAPGNLTEVQITWLTAKKLGISTNDEPAVLQELRKSKRLQFLEDQHL